VAVVTEADPRVVLDDGVASEDLSVRGRAVSALIEADGVGEVARGAVSDPDPWIQRAAVEALCDRDDDASHSLIASVVQDVDVDAYVRGRGAVCLVNAGGEVAVEWAEGVEAWNQPPLMLGAALQGDSEALEGLQQRLRHGELPLEVQFMFDAGRSGLVELLPALREAQGRVEEEMELPVAAAILLLGDPSGEQPLRLALADSVVERRLEALDYVVQIDGPNADALLRRAKAQGPDLVRWYADLVLASRKGNDAAIWSRALGSDDREVRVFAVRYAAELASDPVAAENRRTVRAARQAVSAGLRDADADVRIESLRALGGLGVAGDEDAVRANLTDRYEAVRVAAAAALVTSN